VHAASSLRQGRVDQAIEAYTRILAAVPADIRAWNMRGWPRASGRTLPAHLGLVEVELAPDDGNLLVNRASAPAESGDLVAAVADLDRAIALDETLAVAHAGRGIAHAGARQPHRGDPGPPAVPGAGA
jgi:tetratricopeptide (TPR) repeat protein